MGRSVDRRRQLLQRLSIVDALLVALDRAAEVGDVVEQSEDREAARRSLVQRFEWSAEQAGHVLDMPLSRRTALGRATLEEERAELLRLLTGDGVDRPAR